MDFDFRAGQPQGILRLEFSRTAFLRRLQGFQLTKPLASDDDVEITLRGKMLNGAPLSAAFKVHIVGGHSGHDSHLGANYNP